LISNATTLRPDIDTLNAMIVDSLQDVKGKRITLLDMRALSERPADYFIICEGDSSTQVRALSDRVDNKVREELGVRPYHMEGSANLLWVLVDYGATIVHVFYRETREFYDLESLWGDATITVLPDMS
jgi:ribosome-associated protein